MKRTRKIAAMLVLFSILANFFVISAAAQTALAITKQPESVAVDNVGDYASATVEAVGDGLTYKWFYKAVDSDSFTRSTVTSNTNRYKITEARDGWQLYCVVTDAYGNSVTSDTITFSVKKELKITKQPESVAVEKVNDYATATVEAEGDGLTYQWYYKTLGSDVFTKSTVKSNTNCYKITTARDGWQLYCVVTDAYGNSVTSDTITFSIAKSAITITKQPESVEVEKVDDYASATVEAEGVGLTYQWYYKPLNSDKFVKSTVTANTTRYKIRADRDGWQLYCVVKDANGNSVTTDTITFSVKKAAVVITKQPESVAVEKVNDYATATVEAEGEGLTYQWYYKTLGSDVFTKSTVKSNTNCYKITTARDGWQLYCVVTDVYGNSVTSDTITFSIAKSAITITKQPESVEVEKVDDYASATVEAEGVGLTYQWYYKPLNSDKFVKSTVTANTTRYKIRADRDGWQLYCVIKDANGNSVTTDTITFSVAKSAITIVKQPESVYVAQVDDYASATVEAEGLGLTYQWYYKPLNSDKFVKSTVTANTTRYKIRADRDGWQLYCVIKDANGNTVTTDTITFSVLKAPADLAATPEGDARVNLQWTPADGATAYDVYYKAEGEDAFVLAKTVTDPAAAVEGLTANTNYAFTVYSVIDGDDARKQSVASVEVTAKTYCSASGDHVPGEATHENEVPATCSAEGSYEAVIVCTVCGEELSRETVVTEKLPHTEETLAAVAPDCTNTGLTEGVKCSVCGEILTAQEVVPAKGHTAVIDEAVPATCTEGGKTEGQHCSVCGEVLVAQEDIGMVGHQPEPIAAVPATCTATGMTEGSRCAVCGEILVAPTPTEMIDHEEEPIPAVEPTCYATGLTEGVRCKNCGLIFVEQEEVEKLPHTPAAPVTENEIPGTCAVEGSYDEVVYCVICNEELSRTLVITELDLTNHVGETEIRNARAATCSQPGRTGVTVCLSCENMLDPGETIPVDPNNHSGATEIRNAVAPTCKQAGYEGDTYCLDCGAVVATGNEIAKLAHTPVVDAAVAENCGYPGKTQGSHCSVCGEVIVAQQTIPATGNHDTEYRGRKSPSKCTDTGYKKVHYYCKTCGKLFSTASATTEYNPEDIIYTGNHSYYTINDNPSTLKTAATCQVAGEYYYVCDYCGEPSTTKTHSVGKTDHNYQPGTWDKQYERKAASCLDDAVYDRVCTYCGSVSGSVTVNGSKLGHDFSVVDEVLTVPTCSTKGRTKFKCSRCNATSEMETPVDPQNHPEDKIKADITDVIAPTCVSAGEYYGSSVCKACGTVLEKNEYHYVAPLPHSTEYVAAKAPTCTADGSIAYYNCVSCGQYFSDEAGTTKLTKNDTVVPKLGHKASGTYTKVYTTKTTCTVDGVYHEVSYCANGCGTILDTKPQQTEAKFNHMKNGASAIVDVPASVATCTEPAYTAGTRCTLCNTVMSGRTVVPNQPALGHDYSVENNVLKDDLNGFYCSRCGNLNPNLLATFNDVVNSLKMTGMEHYNYNHGVSYFGKSNTKSDYNKFRSTGIVNILPDVRTEFDSEMKKDETSLFYSVDNGWIRSFLYLKNNPDVVSLLENGDVQSVSVHKLNSLSYNQIIDSSYGNSITYNGVTHDLSQFRSMTVSEPVIAVTVTVNREVYTPKGGVAGVGANDMTALQKVTEHDIRNFAAQYGENGVLTETEEDSGYSMSSTMKLKSIVSTCDVTYYFKAANYEPIAAIYNKNVTTSQDVSMSIKLGVSTGSITVDPYVSETDQDVYLFFESGN